MTRYYLTAKILLFLSITLSAQTLTAAQNCIAIMGDSLPAGTFVAQVPGTGVTVLQSRRIAQILDDALQARDLIHYGIYDLSLAASAITDPNAEPYLTSREYFLGRSLNCRYVVIFPFLNDLYTTDDGGDSGRAIYNAGLNNLVTGIRNTSPDSNIVLMGFYRPILLGAGPDTYGGDVTVAHVIALNNIHQDICADDFKVYCLSLTDLLNPVSDYVVGNISQNDYEIFRFSLVNPADQWMLDSYWQNQPTSVIYGDGVHLNPTGQVLVVGTLMSAFATIDPVNFAPILQ